MNTLRIKNNMINGKAKKIYRITLVYKETYYVNPIKLAETYSAGTAYIIAKAMAETYKTAEHADYIEIK